MVQMLTTAVDGVNPPARDRAQIRKVLFRLLGTATDPGPPENWPRRPTG